MVRDLRKSIAVWTCALALVGLAACGDGSNPESPDDEQAGTLGNPKSRLTVAAALAANVRSHEDPSDYVWDDARVIPILLNGTSITESTDSATVSGTRLTITSGGTYSLTGSLTDGQIIVDAAGMGTVRLLLNGVALNNSSTSPLFVAAADKVVLVLMENTLNTIADGGPYVFPDTATNEPNAAVFSWSDLTICGAGSLTVQGNYDNAIVSKDGLVITGATVAVTSVDDGIIGKDYLIVKGASITATTTGDGLKADNGDDPRKGYIYVESGAIVATCGRDALSAATDVLIANGSLRLMSGGGSGGGASGTTSARGIRGVSCVVVGDGSFFLDCADDAVHSNSCVVLNGGTFSIATGDDAVHADSVLGVNGGAIVITRCDEGLESMELVITDGNIHVNAYDDGLNGSGGKDGSGAGGWPGGLPPTGNCSLTITGGYVSATTVGDGMDINGGIVMTGGTVLVNGPTSNMNGAIDYDAGYQMTGGSIVAAGSSEMAQAPGAGSTQYSILMNFSSMKPAGTLFHIQDAAGNEIISFKPRKPYQSIAFSSPGLAKGVTYEVYLGGNSTGAETDGLYEGGIHTGGSRSASFTISSIVTRVDG